MSGHTPWRKSPKEPLPNFICRVCKQVKSMRWTYRVIMNTSLPPICITCEREYSAGNGMPTGGSIRDRREVMRGFAVAEALHVAAIQKEWRS